MSGYICSYPREHAARKPLVGLWGRAAELGNLTVLDRYLHVGTHTRAHTHTKPA